MWQGVYPALTTKFTEDDRLDFDEMERVRMPLAGDVRARAEKIIRDAIATRPELPPL